jgi:hypothetical protein
MVFGEKSVLKKNFGIVCPLVPRQKQTLPQCSAWPIAYVRMYFEVTG